MGSAEFSVTEQDYIEKIKQSHECYNEDGSVVDWLEISFFGARHAMLIVKKRRERSLAG